MTTATLDSVFNIAMSLDANSRRALAERLWDTVQTKDDSVFTEDTWNEIGRRVASSDAGQTEHIPGAVALAQIRREFGLPTAS